MNERRDFDEAGLHTAAGLASRPDFQLGEALVSPATRTVSGPGGRAGIEPRVMQVLVALADSAGSVVSRDALFERCWGNVFVGEDSLNRTIAGVRKIASTVAGGSFAVETVPRVGYQLVVNAGASPAAEAEALLSQRTAAPLASRRAVVGGALATAAAAAGLGYWAIQSREDRDFDQLLARGQQALDTTVPSDNPPQYFRQAVAIRPRSATAQGLLAYSAAVLADRGNPKALVESEQAMRAALDLDPNEPHARLAQVITGWSMLEFADTEDRLRAILKSAPDNTSVMRHLWNLMQCVGRSEAALALVERALAIQPLASGHHFPRAQLLWILGRTAEADRVIDRALRFWPEHQFARFARFNILAFSGRAPAALAMIEKPETAPQNFSKAAIDLWRVSLAALDRPSPANVARARRANLDAAKQRLPLAAQAVMTLTALGEIDAAFEVANAYFAVTDATARPPARSTAWRFAPWLFTPPVAPLRVDPRFKPISDQIGLTDYWAKPGRGPDAILFKA